MDLSEKVEDLSTSVGSGLLDRMNREWFCSILKDAALTPFRGTIGGFAPTSVKERYFSDDPNVILNKEKLQKSAEIWLGVLGAVSIYLAAFKGLRFDSPNLLAKVSVQVVSASFIGYAFFGIADTVYRLTGHYHRKKKPATITNEVLYYILIEKMVGEERFFSFLDYAESRAKEFYALYLPYISFPG